MTRSPLILVVDPNRDTRELYRACFDLSGYRTAEAANGSEAIAATRMMVPDLLLSALFLPDVDGCAVAEALKADARTAAVCVLLIASGVSEDVHARAANAGVRRVLPRSSSPRVLLREVHRALATLTRTPPKQLSA